MLYLALIEIFLGVIIFFASFVCFVRGGEGNGFKYYAAFILLLNLVIALRR